MNLSTVHRMEEMHDLRLHEFEGLVNLKTIMPLINTMIAPYLLKSRHVRCLINLHLRLKLNCLNQSILRRSKILNTTQENDITKIRFYLQIPINLLAKTRNLLL